MKHCYEIRIGKGTVVRKPIYYTYGQTKTELHISTKGILIRWQSGILKSAETLGSLSDPLSEDAVRKALIIYAVKYGRNAGFQTIEVVIDGQAPVAIDMKHEPILYSMLPPGTGFTIPEALKADSVLQLIADTPKSKYDRRISMLFAFIYARSRGYQYEKFINLWMSMNALYGYLGERVCKLIETAGSDVQQPKEGDLLKMLAAVHGWQYPSISKSDETTVYRKGLAMFKRLSDRVPEEWSSDSFDKMNEFIPPESMEAFMTLWLPYKIRCGFFHAERAMPLLCTTGDRELRILITANRVLERFLEKEIPLWIDPESYDRNCKPIIEKMSSGCISLSAKKNNKPQQIIIGDLSVIANDHEIHL